ncbi:MAG: ROK family transcriptional regulator [Arachnia sp.]
MRTGASLAHISAYNENAVIHALRRLGPTSQTDIAEMAGLSVQTVSSIVRNLMVGGFVRELRRESVGRGRPRVILDIVADARYAVGVHVDPSLMSAVVLDLRGSVVASLTSEEVDPDNPDRSLDVAASMVQESLLSSRIDKQVVLGTCLAVPGPINAVSESIVDTVWLPGWTGFPLGEALGARLGMRVPVVKDTLAAVIGENWVRAGDALDSTMVFVYLGAGTGVGLSLNGEPVRGFSGNAGEVGRMLLALGEPRPRGADGLDNDPVVLVEEAHARGVLDGPAPPRGNLTLVDHQFRALCQLADDGNGDALGILHEAGSRIAGMVVMTTELFDADTVVFGGPYWDCVKRVYEPMTVAALRQPSARGPHPVTVSSTEMGREVGAIGAASVVLDARYVPRAPRRSHHAPSGRQAM